MTDKKQAKKTPQQPTGKEFENFIIKKINDVKVRLRLIEERTKQTREKIKASETNTIKNIKEFKDSVKELDIRIKENQEDIKEIKEVMKNIVKEVEDSAKIQDVKVIEKYVDLLDPTRYATKKEVEKMIKSLKKK